MLVQDHLLTFLGAAVESGAALAVLCSYLLILRFLGELYGPIRV